jgi:hypothetical protein
MKSVDERVARLLAAKREVRLNPPATAEALANAAASTGHPLPELLAALWSAHDGQPDGGPRFFDPFEWLPVEGALESARMMTKVLEDVGREYSAPERWPAEWLPFAEDLGGGMLVVDCKSGEVFEYQSDGEGRESTLATSFEAFCEGALQPAPAAPAAGAPRTPPPVSKRRLTFGLLLALLYLGAMAAFVIWRELQRG